jgi:shikimate kinase
MEDNITLIGMPGAGKSTIGVLLAKTIGFPFTDTDLLIQEKEGKLLQNIINESGISTFLKIEESVILDLKLTRNVIATGGSAVYSEAAMRYLREIGRVVYLRHDCKDIEKRLNNIKTRGVVMAKGKTLKNLFEERTPLYEKHADIILDCTGLNPEEIIEKLYLII